MRRNAITLLEFGLRKSTFTHLGGGSRESRKLLISLHPSKTP